MLYKCCYATVWESPCRELCPRHTGMWVSKQGVSLNLECIFPVSYYSPLTLVPHFPNLQTLNVHIQGHTHLKQPLLVMLFNTAMHYWHHTVCFSLGWMLLSWTAECHNCRLVFFSPVVSDCMETVRLFMVYGDWNRQLLPLQAVPIVFVA